MKNLLFRRQEGQALPIVMLVLAFGAAILVPANVYANTVLIAQRNAKLALIDGYSAEACNTYAMWRLLVNDTDTSTVTCNLNGITATVDIAVVPTSNIISATASVPVSNYPLQQGHELWAVLNIASGN